MIHILLQVLGGTGFTFLMTTLGAAVVFFFRGAIDDRVNRAFLGFASGVMMAASVWSLLLPSIDQSREQGLLPWLPPAAGFAFGGVFLYLFAGILAVLYLLSSTDLIIKEKKPERSFWCWQSRFIIYQKAWLWGLLLCWRDSIPKNQHIWRLRQGLP